MAFKHYDKGTIERAIDNELNRLNKQAVKLAKNGLHHSDTYNKVIWSMIEITGGYGNLNEKIINGNVVYQAKRGNKLLADYAKKKSKKEMTHSIEKSKKITTWENIKKTAENYFDESVSGFENASKTLENNPTAIISKYKHPVDGSTDYEIEDDTLIDENNQVWRQLATHEVERLDFGSGNYGFLIKETGEVVNTYEEAIEEIRRLGSGYYDMLNIPD